MKRKVTPIIGIVLLVVLVLAGCSSSPEPTPAQAPSDVPSFYLNPPQADDAIYGVGSAKMATLDNSRRMSIARAREDIAFQMNAAIEAAIVDYSQEAGVDGGNQVISFVETISRQVTETTLQGTRTEEVAQSADGTVYALVSFPINNFRDQTAQAFQRNEDAAFAEFQAEQALQYLDSQLENSPPQSGNTSDN
jgi:PBP1b-binding outer membrane lipoprotein LpoB